MKFDLIDFNQYNKPEEVSQYELFIDPEGKYYKVKTRYESDQNCTHYRWAEAYLEKNGLTEILEMEEIKNKCKTPLEILINYFGFIRYTHAYNSRRAYLSIPNSDYFGYRLTKEQKEAIYELMYYNKDTVDEDVIRQLEDIDTNYETRRDIVFENLKRR